MTQEQEIRNLRTALAVQTQLIENMRNALRFCARNDAGTFYQQETAKKMIQDQTLLIWDRYNTDGTTAENYREWIYSCGEGREPGGGEKALKELDEYEKELFQL